MVGLKREPAPSEFIAKDQIESPLFEAFTAKEHVKKFDANPLNCLT